MTGADDLTALRISETTRIRPTYAHEVGGVVGNGTTGRRAAEMTWQVSWPEKAPREVELAAAIDVVADRLLPVREVLWDLVGRGYVANWFCFIETSGLEHAVELERRSFEKLLTLPGGLWLDVYPDES